ncbi:molybdopterin-dependent oxidoreductase, partial [Sphingomonas sp. XMGL2]|nr:molybdopterin-dependent oxidoreductase [Sphingomonas quercus]
MTRRGARHWGAASSLGSWRWPRTRRRTARLLAGLEGSACDREMLNVGRRDRRDRRQCAARSNQPRVYSPLAIHPSAMSMLTGEVRLYRFAGTFGVGRVLNGKTAHSQCVGGMVWGIGSALG